MSETVRAGNLITLHYRVATGDDTELVSTFGSTPATLQLGSGELAPPLAQPIAEMLAVHFHTTAGFHAILAVAQVHGGFAHHRLVAVRVLAHVVGHAEHPCLEGPRTVVPLWLCGQLGEQVLQEVLCPFTVVPQHAVEVAQQPTVVPVVERGEGAFVAFHHELHQSLVDQSAIFRAEEPHASVLEYAALHQVVGGTQCTGHGP